jgi:hypothetical protein
LVNAWYANANEKSHMLPVKSYEYETDSMLPSFPYDERDCINNFEPDFDSQLSSKSGVDYSDPSWDYCSSSSAFEQVEGSAGEDSEFSDNLMADAADSEEGDCYDDLDLQEDLQLWAADCKVSAVAVDKLLKILHISHPRLPLTCRSLLKTPTTTEVKQLQAGEYVHFWILNGLLQFGDLILKCEGTCICCQVNIDGLPLFKSSSVQLWPILGKIVNSPSPFVIGVFSGNTKPTDITAFLQHFIEESKLLASSGFTLNGREFTAKVICFICDAPARALLKQIKMHTGYFGCERCIQKDVYCDGRVTFSDTDSVKRTDQDFRDEKYVEHQFKASPLVELDVGLVSGFILDSMHLVHLGVVRRLLLYWIRGPKTTRVSSRHVMMISDNLLHIRSYVPNEFARKPRSLNEMDKWKATEFRQFVLYTGMLVLKPVIEKKIISISCVCLWQCTLCQVLVCAKIMQVMQENY